MATSALIVNPSASAVTPELLAEVEDELQAGGPVETLVSARRGHVVELAAQACRRHDKIYVFSGDGGFNEAVNGIDGDVPVGFLPGGATSVLPRALGLPRDPVACARILARSGTTRLITLGRVNGRRFTFSSGLGLDAELVRAVDRMGRDGGRRPGDLTFVWTFVRLLAARRARFDPCLTVRGHGRAAFALVANCDPYSYLARFPIHVAPEARFELGLDLVAPTRVRAGALPRLAFSVLAGGGGQLRSRDILSVHDADELRIECDGPTPLQADGEDLGDVTHAVFEAERQAMRVLSAGTVRS